MSANYTNCFTALKKEPMITDFVTRVKLFERSQTIELQAQIQTVTQNNTSTETSNCFK